MEDRRDNTKKIKKIVTTTQFEEEHDGTTAKEPTSGAQPWARIKTWSEKLGSLYSVLLIGAALTSAGFLLSSSMDGKVNKDAFERSMESIAQRMTNQDEKITALDTKMSVLEATLLGKLELIKYWVEETGKKNDVRPPSTSTLPAAQTP